MDKQPEATNQFAAWAENFFDQDKMENFVSLEVVMRDFYENTKYKYWGIEWFKEVLQLWCRKNDLELNPIESRAGTMTGHCVDPMNRKKGECIVIKEKELPERFPYGEEFFNWANEYFSYDSGLHRVNVFMRKIQALEDFRKSTGLEDWTSQRFKAALKEWAEWMGYIYNPKEVTNDQGFCRKTIDGKTWEMIYLKE